VRRSIGRPEIRQFSPFLLLDEAHVKAPDGFPDHPHRGFETVTYMQKGTFRHEDFAGHSGTLNPGDLQWMTTGKGIMHSEVPVGDEMTRGLQLWVNLKKEHKMVEPRYQELASKDIPVASKDGVTVKIISGESMGIKSPVKTYTPTMNLDFSLEPNATFTQPTPKHYNTFLYTLDGDIIIGDDNSITPAHHTVLLTLGDHVTFTGGPNGSHFVLIGGEPIDEPVVQHGPFVMNTKEEIRQAILDYQYGRNGFERARGWRSSFVKKNRNPGYDEDDDD